MVLWQYKIRSCNRFLAFEKNLFQSLHTMYTPALDENRVSWKLYPTSGYDVKCSFPKKGNCILASTAVSLKRKLHFTSYPDVGYNFQLTRFSSRAGVYIVCKDWKSIFRDTWMLQTLILRVYVRFHYVYLQKLWGIFLPAQYLAYWFTPPS